MITSATLLLSTVQALLITSTPSPSPTALRRAGAHARMAAAGGRMLRVCHRVEDVASVQDFYMKGLGMSSATWLPDGRVQLGGGAGLHLELQEVEGGGYEPKGGYLGLSVAVPDVQAAVDAATAAGGSVLRAVETVEHGPTREEEDEVLNELVEAVVADPAGYPILLHEAPSTSAEGAATGEEAGAGADADEADEAAGPVISGVRASCHEWLQSQEWYEATLGWSLLRWNSNVHREASLTLTLGPAGAAVGAPVGPRGGAPTDGVIQLTYHYGCNPIASSGGLEAIVLAAAGGGGAAEMVDPDGYVLKLEESA